MAPTTSAPRRAHVGALDGLRGLAVAAVLLFHAGHLRGGFLGVDLFFVLSGFLITGLLLEELGRSGGPRLAAFWERRARRLLPALTVMVASTLLLAWAFARPDLLRYALQDAPWVAAQSVNWHYIGEQIGYWNASGTRLFAHLWSIGVEWQFYLAWPLMVALAGRGPGGHRRVALVAMAGALVSLLLMLRLGTAVDTTRAYEGTDTRASSLLLGAAAATAPVRNAVSRLSRTAVDVICALLLGGLSASWLLTGGENAPGLFQGGMFAHSLAGAALIALLAHAPDGLAGRMIGSAVPRRLGELSYGLYLWHWPVYLLLPRPAAGPGSWGWEWGWTIVAAGLSLLAAVVSKATVEDPIRLRTGWATGRRGWAALAAAAVVAAGLWAAMPRPRPGAGTVDVSRLSQSWPDGSRQETGDGHMPKVLRHVAAGLVAAATLAGCGISDTGVRPAGDPVQGGLTEDPGSSLRVYFVTPQGTWPVSRPAPTGARLQQAMDALLDGPTAAERARGLATQLPSAPQPVRATTAKGRVQLRLPWLVRDLRPAAVSQLVCTAAEAPGVGDDPVIEVFEPGMPGPPWPVRCDESGSAVPAHQGASS